MLTSFIHSRLVEVPLRMTLFRSFGLCPISSSAPLLPSLLYSFLLVASFADMPALAHANAVLMKNTSLENSVICQPQNTNTAGRVFGGFLSKWPYSYTLYSSHTLSHSHTCARICTLDSVLKGLVNKKTMHVCILLKPHIRTHVHMYTHSVRHTQLHHRRYTSAYKPIYW